VAAHCLWDSPDEQPQKAAEVVARIANPTGMRVNQLLIECEQVLSGCDVRNLSSAATAAAKLGEIDRSLAALKSDIRVEKARAHVREQVKRLKLASLEAV
jgi:MoxR-like ATPase